MKYSLIPAVLLLASCSALNTNQSALDTVATGADLYYEYKTGDIVNYLDNESYTDAELGVIIEALDFVEKAKFRIEQYEKSPLHMAVNFNNTVREYKAIRDEYLKLRAIIAKHFYEYSPEQQRAFVKFDNKTIELDANFNLFVKNAEANKTLQTSLSLLNTTLKIVAVM